MNKHLTSLLTLLGLLLALAPAAHAQTGTGVGIGTTAPDASAALDIVSTSKGALLPRLTETARITLVTPAAGLVVYQTDGSKPGFWYNSGTSAAPKWVRVADSNSVSYDPTTGLQVGPGSVQANTLGTFTVGSQSGWSPGPSPYCDTQRTELIVRAASLTAAGLTAGPITSMAFNVFIKNTTTPFQSFTIKLANSSQTAASGFLASGTTTVFSADVTTVMGWNTHTFTTPFTWNGTSNLYIETCYSNPAQNNRNDEVVTVSVSYQGCYETFSPTPCTATASPYAENTVPQLRFTQGQPAGAYTLPATAGVPGQILTQQSNGSVTFQDPITTWKQTGSNLYPNALTSNVGLGTATPASRLDVRSTLMIPASA